MRLENTKGTAKKFWEVERSGATYTARWGRVGAAGQTKRFACASTAAAKVEVDKLVAAKTRKGYVVANGKPAKPRDPATQPLGLYKDADGGIYAVFRDGKDVWFGDVDDWGD